MEAPPGVTRRSGLLRRIVGLFSAGALGQLVAIAAGIVQAHVLGPDGKAVLAYAAIALMLVLLGTDGLSSAALMQSGKYSGALRPIYAATVRLAALLALPCAIVALVLGLVFPSQRALIGVAAALPFAVYAQSVRGILLAGGATSAVAWQGLITTVGLGLVTIAALVWLHVSSYTALAIWCVAQAAAAAYTALVVRRRIARTPANPQAPAAGVLAREQFSFGVRTSAATVAGYLNTRIDVFVIGAMLGARELGIYTLAIALGEMLWSTSLPILYAALEGISGDAYAEAAALTARLMRLVVALQLVLGVVLFVAGPWLLVRVYGEAFAPAGPALRVLLPGLCAYAVEGFLGYFILVQIRRPLLIFAIQSASALVCAGLTVATVGRFGILGAAAATSITYLGVIAFKSIYFARKTGIGLPEQWLVQPNDLRTALRSLQNRLRRDARKAQPA